MNNIIYKMLVSLIMAVIIMLFNFNYFIYYFIHLLLLLVLFFGTIFKKTSWFIFIFVLFIINSLYLLVFSDNIIILFVYYAWNIFMLISSYKYVFNLDNNSMNISFKSLKFPEKNEYLVVRYLDGPVKKMNINGIVVKLRDNFEINLEDRDGSIHKIIVNFKDIDNVTVNVKPYFKSYNSTNGYEVDYLKSSNIGKVTGGFDTHKAKKIIKSYEIIINTKDGNIKLLSFNDPKFMFSL